MVARIHRIKILGANRNSSCSYCSCSQLCVALDMAKKKKKTVGLTTKQKKLPKALQMAILKNKKRGNNMPYHTGKGSHSKGMKKGKKSKMSKMGKRKKKKR